MKTDREIMLPKLKNNLSEKEVFVWIKDCSQFHMGWKVCRNVSFLSRKRETS
jgi:hypothetical protein